jgi:hypothetical protein
MSQAQALNYRDSFPQDSLEWACIDEFIHNARGYENPISKTEWCTRMARLGYRVSTNFLEQRVIRPARHAYDFIGVKRYRGLYLMISREDIEKSAEFYHSQANSMNARGDQLVARLGTDRQNSLGMTTPLFGCNASRTESLDPTSSPLQEFFGGHSTIFNPTSQNPPSIL